MVLKHVSWRNLARWFCSRGVGLNPTEFCISNANRVWRVIILLILVSLLLVSYRISGRSRSIREKNEIQSVCRPCWRSMSNLNSNIIKLISEFSSFDDLLSSHRMVDREWAQVCSYHNTSLWINHMIHFDPVYVDCNETMLNQIYIYKDSLSIRCLMLYEYLCLIKAIYSKNTPTLPQPITTKFSSHWNSSTHEGQLSLFLKNKSNKQYIMVAVIILSKLRIEMQKGNFNSIYMNNVLCFATKYGSLYGALWFIRFIKYQMERMIDVRETQESKYIVWNACYDALNGTREQMNKTYNQLIYSHGENTFPEDYKWITNRLNRVMHFELLDLKKHP
eukprot:226499_1